MTTQLSTNFREAMRRVASTVHVVTVVQDGVPIGMTATAVSSVSMSPPSLLVCINKSASIHAILQSSDMFCVNVLQRDQEDIARQFSNPDLRRSRFVSGGWLRNEDYPPYLPEAAASLVCAKREIVGFATHSIVLGEVVSVHLPESSNPLVYLDGSYCCAGAEHREALETIPAE